MCFVRQRPTTQAVYHLLLVFASGHPPHSTFSGTLCGTFSLGSCCTGPLLVLTHVHFFMSQDISPNCSQHLELSFVHIFPNEGLFMLHISLLRETFLGSTVKSIYIHLILLYCPVFLLLSICHPF